MRGRKPKPTLEKKLAGNPGKRPLNEREPRPKELSRELPRPPAGMDEWGRALWRRVLRGMPGVLTVVDLPLLEDYCNHWSDQKEARKEYRRQQKAWRVRGAGKSSEMNESYQGSNIAAVIEAEEGSRTNPLMIQMRQRGVLLRSLASELGLSPTSRSRIVGEKDGGDELDDFLAGRSAKVVDARGK